METIQVVQTVLLVFLSIATGSMIPWIITVERRLSKLVNGGGSGILNRMDVHSRRLREMEITCAENHGHREGLPPS